MTRKTENEMDYYYLRRSILFEGCSDEEIAKMLTCFDAKVMHYKKNETIISSGHLVTHIGLVLEGSVRIEHVDAWGNTTILLMTVVGKTFGEAYACAPNRPMMMDAVANEDCTVVFLDAQKMMHRCEQRCSCHLRVSTNLTELIALRNLSLSRRAYVLAHPSTRKKLMAFLSIESQLNGKREFDIPLNREQLANYLGVDRSALSAEMSRMRKSGLIEYRKNHFRIAESLDEEDVL